MRLGVITSLLLSPTKYSLANVTIKFVIAQPDVISAQESVPRLRRLDEKENEIKLPGLRFLALDGGEFPRAEISQLLTLDEIVKRRDFDNGANETSRPHEVFDLIGGTAMGGIFAIFFAVFRMTVAEAIKAHSLLDKLVFSTEAWRNRDTSEVHTYLEGTITEIGKLHDVDVSRPLVNSDSKACKAFVCTINPKNMSFPRLLRTYRVRSNSGPDCSVQDALIAAIAGQPHIQPVELGLLSEDFACAINRFGNPINQVLDEARLVFEPSRGVSCIVNIGAGHPGLLAFSPSGEANLESLARDCERQAEEVAKRYSRIENLFFRFSVTHGLDDESQTTQSSVATHTAHYLQQTQVSQRIDQVVFELGNQALKVTAEQLNLIPHHDSGLRKPRMRALPPCLTALIGRDDQTAIAIQSVLSHASTIILGPGGIGKTSVALTVLHDENIQRAFKYIYFVSCEGLTTLELLYAELSACIGIPTEERDASNPREQILENLRKDDVVLCIDNFETLWDIEETRVKVQDTLADFVNLEKLSLMVTMRGSKPPGPLIWWSKSPILLGPLAKEDAFALFQIHSDCAEDDIFAHKLIEAVECVPLAVQLLAAAAGSPDETTEELWERWEELGTKAVSQGKGHRLLDLNTSIELSLNGPRLREVPAARAILALLSLLPGGLNKQGEIFGVLKSARLPNISPLYESLQALTGASLVYMDATDDRRYRLLAPISRYSGDNLLDTLSQSSKRLLITAYVNFIRDRRPWIPSQHDIVPKELANLYNVLKYGLEENMHPDGDNFALAVCLQSEWMEFLGLPSDELLLRAIRECQLSPFGLGHCYWQLGKVYRWLYRYKDAEESLLQAVNLHQQARSVLGEGNDRQHLGEVYLRQNRLDAAEESLLQAVALHQQAKDVLGEGYDRSLLGDVYLSQNRLDTAEESLLQALALHQQDKDILGEGNDRRHLAEIYLRQNRLEEAETSLLQAVALHQQAKDVLGEGNDRQQLGEVYLRQNRLDDADESLLQAVELHRQAKFVLGEGNDRSLLGEVYLKQNRLDTAEESLLQAVALQQHAGDVLGGGNDRKTLGEVYLRQNRLDTAEESLLQAVALHQQAKVVLSEGNDRQHLGEVYLRQNRLEDAEESLLRAMALHQQAKVVINEGNDRGLLGELYLRHYRLEDAEEYLLQAVALHRQTKDVIGEGNDRSLLGEVYLRENRLEEAEQSLLQAVALHRQAKDVLGEGNDRQLLGEVYLRQNRLDTAEESLLQAVTLHQQAKDVLGEGIATQWLGDVYQRRQRLGEAESCYRQAVSMGRQAGQIHNVGAALQRLGELFSDQERLDEAEVSLNEALSSFQQSHSSTNEEFTMKFLEDLRSKRQARPSHEDNFIG